VKNIEIMSTKLTLFFISQFMIYLIIKK